jgi:hypothetical protein
MIRITLNNYIDEKNILERLAPAHRDLSLTGAHLVA